jgi:hypothetical protein
MSAALALAVLGFLGLFLLVAVAVHSAAADAQDDHQ